MNKKIKEFYLYFIAIPDFERSHERETWMPLEQATFQLLGTCFSMAFAQDLISGKHTLCVYFVTQSKLAIISVFLTFPQTNEICNSDQLTESGERRKKEKKCFIYPAGRISQKKLKARKTSGIRFLGRRDGVY